MASITSFIRNTPTASLRAYFNTSGIKLPTALDWDAPARLDGTHRPDPAEPLNLSPDGKRLIILGGAPISFKTDIQIKILRVLVEGFRANKRYSAEELLTDAGSGSGSLRRTFGTVKWAQLSPHLKSTNGLWAFEF